MSTSQRTSNTVQNLSKLADGDINRVNSSNFTATILQFSEKFYYQFSHVFIFVKVFPESHGFVAMPVTRWNNFVALHYLDRDKLEHVSLIHLVTGIYSKETVTLRKHVTKYENMQTWIVEFLTKFETNGIYIARVNSILITKSINLL